MSYNPYKRLLSLLPSTPLQVGDVVAVADGVADIELPGGGTIKARGAATVGQRVFVRDSVIEGEAPSLTLELINI